ncbi:unnamed protein product, partial [Sphagnum compactum]
MGIQAAAVRDGGGGASTSRLLQLGRKIRARICLPPPPRLQNASQILATTRRIVRTNGKEKNRRSGGESERHSGSRGRMALGDGSFQVHFSFVATEGIVFFCMEEFAVRLSNTAFDIATYKFHIPDLRVGTLDSLLALTDDLTK